MSLPTSFGLARAWLALMFVSVHALGTLRADVVFAWNELLLHFAGNTTAPLPPHLEIRVFAMAHLAMNDAITAATTPGANAENQVAAQRAAAVTAAHDILVHLLPTATQPWPRHRRCSPTLS